MTCKVIGVIYTLMCISVASLKSKRVIIIQLQIAQDFRSDLQSDPSLKVGVGITIFFAILLSDFNSFTAKFHRNQLSQCHIYLAI